MMSFNLLIAQETWAWSWTILWDFVNMWWVWFGESMERWDCCILIGRACPCILNGSVRDSGLVTVHLLFTCVWFLSWSRTAWKDPACAELLFIYGIRKYDHDHHQHKLRELNWLPMGFFLILLSVYFIISFWREAHLISSIDWFTELTFIILTYVVGIYCHVPVTEHLLLKEVSVITFACCKTVFLIILYC